MNLEWQQAKKEIKHTLYAPDSDYQSLSSDFQQPTTFETARGHNFPKIEFKKQSVALIERNLGDE